MNIFLKTANIALLVIQIYMPEVEEHMSPDCAALLQPVYQYFKLLDRDDLSKASKARLRASGHNVVQMQLWHKPKKVSYPAKGESILLLFSRYFLLWLQTHIKQVLSCNK
jgi:hypothetical protein